MGSYYLRQWHMRWFSDRITELGAHDISARDISDTQVGFGPSGPRSREVPAKLDHQYVSNEALPFTGYAALDADASSYEPVWKNGRRVGFVTSGDYGHHVDKSLAMALVGVEHAQTGEELHTHVVGVERGARIIESSPYDPGGAAMRR